MKKKKIVKVSKVKTSTSFDINKALQTDVYKLNTKTLKGVVNNLVKEANKRLHILNQKAPRSPALAHRRDEHGNIPHFDLSKAKNRNDIEKVMKDVKNFLQAPTSTLEGYQDLRDRIETDLGAFESTKQEDDFWRAYNDYVDKHPNLVGRFNDTNTLQKMLYDQFVVRGKTLRGSKANITKTLNKMLEENAMIQTEQNKALENELKNSNVLKMDKDI